MSELRAEVAVRKSDKVMFHVLGLLSNKQVKLIGQDRVESIGDVKDFNFYTYVDRKRVYVEE